MKNNRKSLVIAAILAGSIAAMSGCGASDKPTSKITSEVTSEPVIETQSVQETETQTEIETSSELSSETETQTETQTETETQIETQTETEKTKETETVSQPEAPSETQVTPESEAEPEPVAAAEGSVSEGDYAVVVKGALIPLGGDMRNYVGTLGDPDEFGSAKSCTEAGEDKVYTYGGTVIYTYITNGADIISLIEVTGGEVLPSGIHIGSTKDEVIAAYGRNYTEEGSELLYELGGKTIGLQMTNDKVSFMELFGR
ncbi:MAG: hypothetical protein K1W16_10945 [Lachnospiraceae bacterium]|jgi:Predicted solute binding protein